VKIEAFGFNELDDILRKEMPDDADQVLSNATLGIAKEVAKEAKKRVPKDTGGLRRSISTRKNKRSRFIRSDVYVKWPMGAHWVFHEYGTIDGIKPLYFFRDAKAKINASLDQYLSTVVEKELNKMLKRRVKRITGK